MIIHFTIYLSIHLFINFLIIISHPNLPSAEQKKVFQPTPRGFRKVILATGMAETGLTIDNITCVIDSGFETVLM